MASKGIYHEGLIISDNKFHRWNKAKLWYIFNETYGAFGNWSTGEKYSWSINDSGDVKVSKKLQEKAISATSETENKISKQNDAARVMAKRILDKAVAATDDNPYLQSKQVGSHNLLQINDTLVVPAYSVNGEVTTIQFITTDQKRFLKGGKKRGSFFVFGNLEQAKGKKVYIAEGVATAATVYEASGDTTVCAFDAGNIVAVCDALFYKLSGCDVVIAADNDQWKDTNTGIEQAEIAAAKYGYSITYPDFTWLDEATKPTDFNDLQQLSGLDKVKEQLQNIKTITKLPEGFELRKDGIYHSDRLEFMLSN